MAVFLAFAVGLVLGRASRRYDTRLDLVEGKVDTLLGQAGVR